MEAMQKVVPQAECVSAGQDVALSEHWLQVFSLGESESAKVVTTCTSMTAQPACDGYPSFQRTDCLVVCHFGWCIWEVQEWSSQRQQRA